MQSEQCVETAARRDTILVVDDVELNRVILSEAFREGYRLLEAENGRQALDQVLNKPGRLTAEEFELMKIHTVRGCELLEQIPQYHSNPLFRYAYDICRHHHERVDGRGYPDGLKGEELSIWSQVVALADVYDALTNKRVYKPAFTHEKAMEMIRTGQCGQFQPALVDALAQGLEHHARGPETN